ncbi:MAG: hypothetical protein ABI155_04205 [Paralcaligenes sp.]
MFVNVAEILHKNKLFLPLNAAVFAFGPTYAYGAETAQHGLTHVAEPHIHVVLWNVPVKDEARIAK